MTDNVGHRSYPDAPMPPRFEGTSALEADHFGRRYGRSRRWAVKDLSVQIAHGTITALVGPNGAGKSTLLRSWVGFEPADRGHVLVNGLDVRHHGDETLRQIAYVSQANSLYPSLTISDHFQLAHIYRASFDMDRAFDHTDRLGLEEDRPVGELSGGEKAQVSLAIALALRTPILLLDEPLASLDPLARRDFLVALVRAVRETDSTAVLSSHIVTDVEQACDSLIVLSVGELLLHDTLANVRQTHIAVPATHAGDGKVGEFVGPTGEIAALVKTPTSTAEGATIEEVVLGYLASQRTRGSD